MENTTEIVVNRIVKETEKATCFNITVSWGEGKWIDKDIWFPKSAVEVFEVNGDTHIAAADWIVAKISTQNAFKGYRMNFCRCFNPHYSC